MPAALSWWTAAHDAQMMTLYKSPGATCKNVANRIGVSRSFVQRRVTAILKPYNYDTVLLERLAAGEHPLPPRHPLAYAPILAITHSIVCGTILHHESPEA